MKKGFYTIMAAQFFSSLADNALLIAAIALLKDLHAPNWMTPLLKLFFVLSYVVLAAFVGAFADSRPKGRVMFVTNTIKVVGCLTMLVGAHPLIAYGIVGFGAAAYSPAKYGILTELLPPDRLVAANGWIEGTTVGSIILGTVLGGALISPHIAAHILRHHIPTVDTPAEAAMLVIMAIYIIAALFNLRIPDTGARYPKQERGPIKLITDFADCFLDALARQARPDFARRHDAVLGRRRNAAIHRAEVGRSVARHVAFGRRDPAGGRRGRRGGRRDFRGVARAAEEVALACCRSAS